MACLLPAGSRLMFLSIDTMAGVGRVNTTPSDPPLSSPPFNADESFYRFNAGMAITVVVVISVFLFISLFLLYLRNRWTAEGRIISFGYQEQQEPTSGLPDPHGLDPRLVEKFPLVRYGSAKLAARDGNLGNTDCSVCLTEFEDDEKVRILPNCGHGFHADCIDVWLLSHSTCPLCRISLLPSTPHHIITTTLMATDPPAQPQSQHHPPHLIAADALSGDDPQSLSETRGSSRSLERLAVRVLSRNSESFRKAAQDVEISCAGEVERDGSATSSRRWKILRIAWPAQPPQETSTSNAGEQADPNLLSNMKTGKEATADDNLQHSMNNALASDRWGSARNSDAGDEGYSSATKSDTNPITEAAQQTERKEETEWVSIEIDSTTSSLRSRQQHTQHIDDPMKVESSQAEA